MTSDSEFEDNEATRVTVLKRIKEGNEVKINEDQCAVCLKEIGPRLTLECVTIEELINTGRVLYHRYVQKSEEEIMELEKKNVRKKFKRSKKTRTRNKCSH